VHIIVSEVDRNGSAVVLDGDHFDSYGQKHLLSILGAKAEI